MSDPYASLLPSFFFANNGPGVNLKLREKIALAQMMQRRKAPSNLGEGLSAIGDSLGEMGIARRLEEQDKISQEAASRMDSSGGIAAAPVSPPPVQAAAVAAQSNPNLYTPDRDPRDPTAVQGNVQEGGPTPSPQPMFRPNLRTATVQPGTATPAPQAAPTRSMVQESVPPDVNAPIRTNPDGTLAGNLTSPQVLPPPAGGRPTVADYGQKLALAPTPSPQPAADALAFPPVVPMGGEPRPDDPRREVAMALLRQQAGGQARSAAPPAPAPQAAAPPEQNISAAPPTVAQIQKAPAPEERAYVPAPLGAAPQAKVIPPSPEELVLQTKVNRAIMSNPYAAQSPDALRLKLMQEDRAKRQTVADEVTKAEITRDTDKAKLREQGLMDEEKRRRENERMRLENADLPTKLAAEAEKRRLEIQKTSQGLITPSATSREKDPYIGTPQSSQRDGLPKTPPTPPGSIPEDWAKKHTDEHFKNTQTVEAAAPELKSSLDLIQKLREHPAREMGVGAFSKLYANTPQGAAFKAILDQISGKNFLSAYQKLKGTGSVSEIEGLKTEQSQARLIASQDKEGFNSAIDDLESELRGGFERAQRKVNQPVTAYQNTPNDPYAPDMYQLGTRGGKTVEYIGGDPSKDSSYRTPRR